MNQRSIDCDAHVSNMRHPPTPTSSSASLVGQRALRRISFARVYSPNGAFAGGGIAFVAQLIVWVCQGFAWCLVGGRFVVAPWARWIRRRLGSSISGISAPAAGPDPARGRPLDGRRRWVVPAPGPRGRLPGPSPRRGPPRQTHCPARRALIPAPERAPRAQGGSAPAPCPRLAPGIPAKLAPPIARSSRPGRPVRSPRLSWAACISGPGRPWRLSRRLSAGTRTSARTPLDDRTSKFERSFLAFFAFFGPPGAFSWPRLGSL